MKITADIGLTLAANIGLLVLGVFVKNNFRIRMSAVWISSLLGYRSLHKKFQVFLIYGLSKVGPFYIPKMA